MALTIESMLKLSVMDQALLKAGHAGIHRTVESVNVMDAPDIANWVKPNELILTTAYVIKDDIEAQIRLIEQLANRQCAGLAIKTKRYLEQIPTALIEQANAYELPLIELPLDISIGDLMSVILSHVLNLKKLELEQAIEVHRRFSSLFLKGADMFNIAQTLGSIVHYPVAILNSRYGVLGHSKDFSPASLEGHILNQIVEAMQLYRLQENTLFEVLTSTTSHPSYSIYPVYSTQLLRGYILIEHQDAVDISSMSLEQAANVISYESITQEARSEGEKRLRSSFFSELFDNTITSQDEIIKRCSRYGLMDGKMYWIAVGRLDLLEYETKGTLSEKHNEQLRDLLLEQMDTFTQKAQIDCVSSTQGDLIVFVFSFAQYESTHEETLLHLIEEFRLSRSNNNKHVSCSFGLGNHVDQLMKIPQAYREAVNALKYGYASQREGFTLSYRTQEIPELIRLLPHQKLKEFHESALKGLAHPKDSEQTELLRTLETYLQHNCLVSETARILFVHRNTVFYRLNKCEEILNVDLKDPIDTMKLRLALVIHRLIHASD